MAALTENIVLSRTRAQDLNSVRKLNCWGSELEDVSIVRQMPQVEVLSLSVNSISTLADFSYCKNLQELYLRKNCVWDLSEVVYLKDLPHLRSLWLADNPCAESADYRLAILRALPNLQKLDNTAVHQEEIVRAKTQGRVLCHPLDPNREFTAVQEPSQAVSPQRESKQEHRNIENADQVVRRDSYETNGIVSPGQATGSTEKTTSPIPKPARPASYEVEHAREVEVSSRNDVVSEHWSCTSPEQTNVSPPVVHGQQNQAFYARVQTLVAHSGRRKHKTRDLSSESLVPRPTHLPEAIPGENLSDLQLFDPMSSEYDNRYKTNDMRHSFENESHSSSSSLKLEKGSPTRILPKGGKNRNSNILSAVLCLVKELDYASLEVVETAIHCQMEELDQLFMGR